MIEINLTKDNDWSHKVIRFPDGQQNVVLSEEVADSLYKEHDDNERVYIFSRLCNWGDLEKICAAVACVKEHDNRIPIGLYCPYFLGARSDRRFEMGGNYYLRDVICPVINNLKLDAVVLLNPHSDVLPNLLTNSMILEDYQQQFVQDSIQSITDIVNLDGILVPDAGAVKKITSYKLDLPLFFAEKVREPKTGKILHTEIFSDVDGKNAVILDDICDGGKTFVELAKEFRKKGGKKLYLAVTHGIFSKGFAELGEHLNGIYVTNSYMDVNDIDFVHQLKVI